MADLKISQLTAASTPLAGTELVPIVQGGVTKKVAVSDLTAGRAVTGLSFNGLTLTAAATGFTIAGGTTSKTLTVGNTLSLAGTDGTTMTFPSTNATIARTDTGQTFTGNQIFNGYQQTSTGTFNNVGTAQTIAVPTGQAGHIVITGVQGGVGASSWTVPFVNRLGTTAVSAAPTKAVVTADPISTVTASGANIVITPLAANTYISYAIYYTPCAV